ncbi:hypothetical protein ACFE04_008221 [Oxalis oulophora]
MYGNSARNSQLLYIQPSSGEKSNLFREAIYGAGSDLMKTELSAYKDKLLGSAGSAYVNTNISRYFSDPRYYFEVNEQYVKSKLKVILFPFFHRGHWMRTTETIAGKLTYKPPIYDINAPDLYIPLMAFGTYLVLSGFFMGINEKFSPEALGVQCVNGLLCWTSQVLLLEATLHTLGDGDVLLLDVVAYGGYTFAPVSIVVIARFMCRYCFYVASLWQCLSMGMFFVKVMKRILIAEVRSCEKHSSKRHYLLLLVAVAQFPLIFWLGNAGL